MTEGLPPHVRRVETRHGPLIVPDNDRIVGRSLATYGEWTWPEIELLVSLLRPGDVALDVGAYIGTHAIPMARAVGPAGAVLAFEPQPKARALLEANLALNGVAQVRVSASACGARAGRAPLRAADYGQPGNFGALPLEPDTGEGECGVEVIALDDLQLPSLRLIKADVEGMEADVVRGARALIERRRPVLYLECEQPDQSAELLGLTGALGYRAFWHAVPLFNPANLRGVQANVFGAACCINVLALPPDIPDPPGAARLERAEPANQPRRRLMQRAERLNRAVVAARCRRARALAASGRAPEARAAFEQALRLAPDNAEARAGLDDLGPG